MRLVKKFLLAAGLVGLVGSFGFASETKAAGVGRVLVEPEVNGTVVTWDWGTDPDDESEYEYEYEECHQAIFSSATGGKICAITDEDILDDCEVDLADYISASGSSAAQFSGKVTVELILSYDDEDDKTHTGTAKGTTTDDMTAFYKQTVTSSDFSKGTVSVDGDNKTSAYYFYANANDTYTIDASAIGANSFKNWQEDKNLSQYATITVSKASTYTAEFDVAATGITLKGTVGSKSDSNSISMYIGDTLTLSATLTPNNGKYLGYDVRCTDSSVFESTSGVKWKAKAVTGSTPVEVYVELTCLDGTVVESNRLRVYIDEKAYSESKFSIKADNDYLTDSYKMDLTPDFSVKGTYTTGIVWEVVKGDVKLTGLNSSSNSGSKVTDDKGVEVTATEGKVSSGETKEVEIKATLPKGKSETEAFVVSYKFTVYPKNTLSYSTSDRELSYKAPAKVNTGKTDGVDSDNKDSTKTAIPEVKGVKLQVFNGDSSLGSTSVAKSEGTSATIKKDTVESIINNLNSKFSGDSTTVKFRAYPCDGDAKYNKHVYAEASTTVYRVEFKLTKDDGTTSTEAVYGLEGQVIDISKNSALKGYTISDKDGKEVTSVTVKTSSSDNKYTGVMGERAADNSGLDRVPRTGQSNVFVYIMVAVVACAVCFGLYAYNKKSRNA